MNMLGVFTNVRVGFFLLVALFTASAVWALDPVTYLDENGEEQTITDYTLLTGNESPNNEIFKKSGWFVVKGEVTYNENEEREDGKHVLAFKMQYDKNWYRTGPDVNLILADGAKLTAINTENNTEFRNLSIYAQSTGKEMGQFELTSKSHALLASNAITINGGSVKVASTDVSDFTVGIFAEEITINGGKVDATGLYGIKADRVFINGGSVSAAGFYGIDGCYKVIINGGVVDATATGVSSGEDMSYAIGSLVNFAVNGGSVSVHAKDKSSYGMYIGGVFNGGAAILLNGGVVIADGEGGGFGIHPSSSPSSVVLAGATVTTNSYTVIERKDWSSVKVAEGFCYTDAEGHVFDDPIFEYKDGMYIDKLDAVAGKTLYPHKFLTLEFVTDDENVKVEAQKVVSDRSPKKPKDPYRYGYKFGGWYADKSHSQEFNFETKLTENTTVYAKWEDLPVVDYIDENGKVQQINSYGELSSITDVNNLASGWYVVKSGENVVLKDIMNQTGNYRIILEDGSHLTVNSLFAKSIFIYGQKEQTGAFMVVGGKREQQEGWLTLLYDESNKSDGQQEETDDRYGFFVMDTLAIYGGDISVGMGEDNPAMGLVSSNVIIVADGSVSVSAKNLGVMLQTQIFAKNPKDPDIPPKKPGVYVTGGKLSVTVPVVLAGEHAGIVSFSDIHITGGDLYVAALPGIVSLQDIYLDWTRESDRYMVANYMLPSGKLKIADGKAFKDDGGNLYYGEYEAENIQKFNGKILSGCNAYSIQFAMGDTTVTKMFMTGTQPEAFTPTLLGFSFLGWFTGPEFDAEIFDFEGIPTGDTTVYARWEPVPPVDYINDKGETETIVNYVELVGGENMDDPVFKKGGWFVVKGEFAYGKGFDLGKSDAHIILMDGSKLTVETEPSFNNLSIYGQSTGDNRGQLLFIKHGETQAFDVKGSFVVNSGAVLISGSRYGIYANSGNVIVNGGLLQISAEIYGIYSRLFTMNDGDVDVTAIYGIYSNESIEVNGGTIHVHAKDGDAEYSTVPPYAIYSTHNLNLNAGLVTTEGAGGLDAGNIYFKGGAVKANRYHLRVVNIMDDLQYVDEEGNLYTDKIMPTSLIEGQTVKPHKLAIEITEFMRPNGTKGTLAKFDGEYDEAIPATIDEKIRVDSIQFKRMFATKGYVTIMLPFDVSTEKLSGVKSIVLFDEVDKNYNVVMQEIWNPNHNHIELQAHTPYMMQMGEQELQIRGEVELQPMPKKSAIRSGKWLFVGTNTYKIWKENDKELTKAFGYSAKDVDDKIKAGDYIKIGAGCYIKPFRAYLLLSEEADTDPLEYPLVSQPKPSTIAARKVSSNGVAARAKTRTTFSMPEQMNVVVIGLDDNGNERTTVIGSINTRTGEFKTESIGRMFDLKGRSVNKKIRNARGAYYRKNVLEK